MCVIFIEESKASGFFLKWPWQCVRACVCVCVCECYQDKRQSVSVGKKDRPMKQSLTVCWDWWEVTHNGRIFSHSVTLWMIYKHHISVMLAHRPESGRSIKWCQVSKYWHQMFNGMFFDLNQEASNCRPTFPELNLRPKKCHRPVF